MRHGPQFDTPTRLLDAPGMCHRVLAQNIANVNTPGYPQLDVAFNNAFAREQLAGLLQHLLGGARGDSEPSA